MTGAVLRGSATDTPRYAQPDYWAISGTLPTALREEARLVAAVDREQTQAAIAVWMAEHHGVLLAGDNSEIRPYASHWILPPGRLAELDRFLDGLGWTARQDYSLPLELDWEAMDANDSGNSKNIFLPRIAVAELSYKRDGLRWELERMRGRAPALPNIVRLATAYANTADAIVAAQKRYERELVVDIDVAEAASGGSIGIRGQPERRTEGKRPRGLLLHYGRALTRGAVCIPMQDDSSDDYLTWYPIELPKFDQIRALKVVIEAGDAVAALKRLDAAVRGRGGWPLPIKAKGPIRRLVAGDVGDFIIMRPVGYFVPRDQLDALRKVVMSRGRLVAWEWRNLDSHLVDVDRRVYDWGRVLAEELRGEEDRLAPYPLIQSLVADQIRKLHVLEQLVEDDVSVARMSLEVQGKP